MFTGDPVRFGFPKPDYKIYESHPIVNSLILHHLGHGDLHGASRRRPARRRRGRRSSTARSHPYDVIVLATGYHLHYPFLSPELLRWSGRGSAPDLYLNIFTQEDPNLFVLGMIEASGIGWQGRYEQAELVASYLRARTTNPAAAAALEQRVAGPRPDLSGRIPLPRAGTDVLLRQQGRLPLRRAVGDRSPRAAARSHRMTVLLAQVTTLVTDIDNVNIEFSSGASTVLKIVIATILFGIALDIKITDFTAVLRRPFPILVGIVAQFLLLPALTLLLTIVLDVRGSIALGMILVACCPPGNVSNILTHRAGGDVALSVSMTAISNLLTIFMLPISFAFWGGLSPAGKRRAPRRRPGPGEDLPRDRARDRAAVRRGRHHRATSGPASLTAPTGSSGRCRSCCSC